MLDRPPKRKSRPRFANAAGPHGKNYSAIENLSERGRTHKPFRAELLNRREVMIRLRQQRLVQRLYDLGPAPLVPFLDELAAEAGCGIAIDHLLKRYGAVDPVFVRALGGDKFPPAVHLLEVAV